MTAWRTDSTVALGAVAVDTAVSGSGGRGGGGEAESTITPPAESREGRRLYPGLIPEPWFDTVWSESVAEGTMRPKYVGPIALAGVLVVSCTAPECLTPPCPLPLAVTIHLTSA